MVAPAAGSRVGAPRHPATIDTSPIAARSFRAVQRETTAERLDDSSSGAWRTLLIWALRALLLALVVAAGVWGLRHVWFFTIDDAGISYAYAKHIAEGDGPVAAVGGPWVEGYSNPLWVFLLIPLHVLGADLPVAAKWLGAGLLALGAAAGCGYLAQLSERRWASVGVAAAAFVCAWVTCLELVVWVPAGLENALLSGLLLGLLYLDARESRDPEALPLSGVVAFLISITRPEGVMYAAPIVALQLAWALFGWAPRRRALRGALLFLAPLALYHLLHFLVFGSLLPNTYLAKPGGTRLSEGVDYLLTNATASGLLYVTPLALIGLYGRPRAKLPIAWVCLAGVAFVLYAGGDWMPHARFLSTFAPALLLLAGVGLGNLAALATRLTRGALPAEGAALGLAALLLVPWVALQRPRLQKVADERWCHFCERVTDMQRLERLAAGAGLPSHSVVTHDFGGPSWLSNEHFYPLDFLGLCDRSAAQIRRARPRGGFGADPRLYQYFIHEQPSPPTWLLVPPNFWPRLDHSPEYLWDYYELDTRLLPRTRRDSFFALDRGELVDFFPPVPSAGFRPLPRRLALAGFGVFADPAATPASSTLGPDARALAVLSVVPRAPERGLQIQLRLTAGGVVLDTPPMRLDRGIEGVAARLDKGEPLAFEIPLSLPPTAAPSFQLSLGVSVAGPRARQPPVEFVELGELAPGAPLPAFERSLPRSPSALPPPRVHELRALRPTVTRVIDQSRRAGRQPSNETLAQSLIALGHNLEHLDLEQAYLAYVWATQVDRRAWEELADTVDRLRSNARSVQHSAEIVRLRRWYASGSSDPLLQLVAFYLDEQRPLEAAYFLERAPQDADPERLGVLRDAVQAALGADLISGGPGLPERIAVDPLGGSLDFESAALAGWQGNTAAFGAGPDTGREGLFGLRGEHGRGVLSSRAAGEGQRGALTSPEFILEGRELSLLVGGGSARRRCGVEVLIEGKPTFSISGNDSDNLFPMFWDITPYAGKPARLRVFDQNTREHVVIDRVLLWK